jgi:hypothetical protein
MKYICVCKFHNDNCCSNICCLIYVRKGHFLLQFFLNFDLRFKLKCHYFFISFSYSFHYIDSEGSLAKTCKTLSDRQTENGRAYIFGGVFKIIRSVKGNWRPVVHNYVRVVKEFARTRTSPVIIQLPWRDDSVGIFRVQREQVVFHFISHLKFTFKEIKFTCSLNQCVFVS